jgi:hypothetical protein
LAVGHVGAKLAKPLTPITDQNATGLDARLMRSPRLGYHQTLIAQSTSAAISVPAPAKATRVTTINHLTFSMRETVAALA